MNQASNVTETSVNSLPDWTQIALLLFFVGLLVLRCWLDPFRTGSQTLRRTLSVLRKPSSSETDHTRRDTKP